jgi:hypothetical protein
MTIIHTFDRHSLRAQFAPKYSPIESVGVASAVIAFSPQQVPGILPWSAGPKTTRGAIKPASPMLIPAQWGIGRDSPQN